MYVYEIRNSINGKRYIGQSRWNNNKRLNNHRYYLRKGIHPNCYLQSAWNKYGEDSFEWNILSEAGSVQELDKLEKLYFDKYNTLDRKCGYNMRPPGTDYHYHTQEVRDKIGDANRGNTQDESLKLRYARERRIYEYPKYVLDPNGNKHKVDNIKGLCKKHNINDANFRRMLRGEYSQSMGWTVYIGETNYA